MNENCKALFEALWDAYTEQNPGAKKVFDLFEKAGESVSNDHIAFRTFNVPSINIDVMAKPFLDCGYVFVQDYHFPAKKLYAKHFEHPGNMDLPRIFISELLLEEFSPRLQMIVKNALERYKTKNELPLVLSGNLWGPVTHREYEALREESEYAAWLYVHGFKTNHFTVSVNHLKNFPELIHVNNFLKEHGFEMNNPQNEIQGSPDELLEQSSIKAELQEVDFKDGKFVVPACYYEFAKRYPDTDGKLYSGFIAKSADKIFESTNFYKKQ